MNHLSLFNGIGGFQLAAEWIGWENVASVEIDEFCNKVTKKHFPNCKQYGDIKQFNGTEYRQIIDIISGGFPCQPYSASGKRLGKDDERHLWPEMLRVIQEVQPSYVVGENVRGITNWNGGMVFDEVQSDLETQGYEVLPFLLPACAVNAPHQRDRIWFIAHSISKRRSREKCNKINRRSRREEICKEWDNRGKKADWIETATRICRINDGLPNRVDRLKSLGNAIVPQVAFEIFKVIDNTKPEGRSELPPIIVDGLRG